MTNKSNNQKTGNTVTKTSVVEVGHAKNVANLLKLKQAVATFGASYNPTNTAITTTALDTLHTNANIQLSTVNNVYTVWKNASNDRELAFTPLGKLTTKILGSVQSLGIPQQTINDLVFLVKKFRSKKTKAAKISAAKGVPPVVIDPGDPVVITEPSTHSTSQQSFDNQLQHFEKIILIVSSVSSYSPNETDCQVTTLQTQLVNLNTINDLANNSYANIRAERINRNTLLYAKTTGMIEITKQVKAYVKSVYGAKSPQTLMVNAIKFSIDRSK